MAKRTDSTGQTPLLDQLPALADLPTDHMRLLRDIAAGRFTMPTRPTDGVSRLAIIPAAHNFGGTQSRDVRLPKLARRINIRGYGKAGSGKTTSELIVRFAAWLAQQAEQFERELVIDQ